jgi:hypothetical protein
MKKSDHEKKKVTVNVAKALADVPIDNKQERDDLRVRLRQTYSELEPIKSDMKQEDRARFEELGELLDRLEQCESRPHRKRSQTLARN